MIFRLIFIIFANFSTQIYIFEPEINFLKPILIIFAKISHSYL